MGSEGNQTSEAQEIRAAINGLSIDIRRIDAKLETLIQAESHMEQLPAKFEDSMRRGAEVMSDKIITALDSRNYNSIPTKVLFIVIFAMLFSFAGGAGLKIITDGLRAYLNLPA